MRTDREQEIVDSVLRDCLEPMRRQIRQPMAPEESRFLASLIMSPDAGDRAAQILADPEAPFALRVAAKRVTVYTRPVDPRVVLFISSISDSPAKIVLYLSYLYWRAKEKGLREITLSDMCDIYPVGFLNDEDYRLIWDGQKIDGANGLDMSAIVAWLNEGATTPAAEKEAAHA